jgi:RHS repeat-associated protein
VVTNYVWMDGFPVAAIKPSGAVISALHTDPLAAPVAATNAAKALVWSAWFTPFGGRTVVTTGPQQDLLRKGIFTINGSNVNRNGYRDFSFQSNVFTERDPIGLRGGLNGYVANRNNPLKFVDPWGLQDDAAGEKERQLQEDMEAAGEPAALLETPHTVSILPTARNGMLQPGGSAAGRGTAAAEGRCTVSTPASTPIGRSGNPLNVPPGTNTAGEVSGRNYVDHAFDQMQGRGLMPSAVEDTIRSGIPSSDPIPGRTRFYNPVNNITVVTEADGTVVTVIPGRR